MIKVNSIEYSEFDGKNISELLTALNYKTTFLAVEKNGDIVPKTQYADTVLSDGDELEVVSFVGGG